MRATIAAVPPSWDRPAGGRGTRIRTGDLEYPKLPRYQTALCPAGCARTCAGSIHGSLGASKAHGEVQARRRAHRNHGWATRSPAAIPYFFAVPPITSSTARTGPPDGMMQVDIGSV